jgi:hypothetical protein
MSLQFTMTDDEESIAMLDKENNDSVVGSVIVVRTKGPATKKKPPTDTTARFRWLKKVRVQRCDPYTGVLVVVYPFLDNENEQDYHFSKALFDQKPYKAPYSQKAKAWEAFYASITQIHATDGSLPFLHLTEKTARSRFLEYQKLHEPWCEKTGAKDANHKEDDSDGNKGGLANEIRRTVLKILEDITDAKKQQEAISTKAALEASHVQELKARALGCVTNESVSTNEFALGARGFGVLQQKYIDVLENEDDSELQPAKKKSRRKSNSTESDLSESKLSVLEMRFKEKEQRKLEELALKKQALDTEAMRIKMESQRSDMMAKQMKEQMKMSMDMMAAMLAMMKKDDKAEK